MRYRAVKSKTRLPFHLLILYGLIAGLIIGISALAITLLYGRLQGKDRIEDKTVEQFIADDFDGTIEIDPPIPVSDIELVNTDNQRMSLSELRGKLVLLTFGFSNCPDVCPLTLNNFERIRMQLERLADEAHFVFISVDAARDTPAALREYFTFRGFDRIIALTGDEADVRAFGLPFGLAFEISDEVVPGGYLVNHTAGSFLLDTNGRWIMRYQFGVPPSTIAADLRRLLQA